MRKKNKALTDYTGIEKCFENIKLRFKEKSSSKPVQSGVFIISMALFFLILIGGIIPRSADHMTGSTVARPGLRRSVKRANFRLSCCDLGVRVCRHYQDTHTHTEFMGASCLR